MQRRNAAIFWAQRTYIYLCCLYKTYQKQSVPNFSIYPDSYPSVCEHPRSCHERKLCRIKICIGLPHQQKKKPTD